MKRKDINKSVFTVQAGVRYNKTRGIKSQRPVPVEVDETAHMLENLRTP
jgi:hypothetical protein